MIRLVRDLRLIPIVLVASVCLLTLKAADLVLGGGGRTSDDAPAAETAPHVVHVAPGAPPDEDHRPWAQQMFNFPNAGDTPPPPPNSLVPPALPALAPLVADQGSADITGSVKTGESGEGEAKSDETKADAAKSDAAKSDAAKPGDGSKQSERGRPGKDGKPQNGTVIKTEGLALPTGAERLILERLQERRQQLDTRARELDIREGLLSAAEKRVEARLAELKEVEAHIAAASEKKDEAETIRLKSLVAMYENMKPRDAAKIFDRLELGVLIDVASQIKPRTMADILAQMSPDVAEHLTVELASRAHAADKPNGELPKIEGRSTTP
jgi:flagellar motility protein MotE (MotC chaperone)